MTTIIIILTVLAIGALVLRTRRSGDIQVGALIRKTAGRRHGWYESSIGPVRKPLR